MSSRLRALAVLALPVMLAGCEAGEEPQRQPAGAPLHAAIVPGANLVVEADLQAVRQAPIFAVVAPMLAGDDEDAESAEPEDGSDDEDGESKAPDGDRFLEALGLEPGDLISLVLSARLDSGLLEELASDDGDEAEAPAEGEEGDVEAEAFDPGAYLDGIRETPAALALLVAKPLDLDALERAMREGGGEGELESLTRVEIAGAPVLHAVRSTSTEPEMWSTVLGGNTLFVAFNQSSIEGLVERATSGRLAETAPEVQSARGALPGTSQGSLVFVAPEALREMIRGRIAEAAEDPGAAMMLGFVKPFENLVSIGLGVEAAEDLSIATTFDLGDAALAGQAQAMFGGMLMPMAQAGLAQAAGRSPGEMADRLQITNDGPTLRLLYRMTAQDAAGFEETRRKEAAAKAAAEAEAEEGEPEDPGA